MLHFIIFTKLLQNFLVKKQVIIKFLIFNNIFGKPSTSFMSHILNSTKPVLLNQVN